jgi:hypothetical protein
MVCRQLAELGSYHARSVFHGKSVEIRLAPHHLGEIVEMNRNRPLNAAE